MELKKKDVFLICTIGFLSICMLIFYINKNYSEHYYDEVGYIQLAQFINQHGLFNSGNDLRTYLYSFLISIFSAFLSNINHVKIIFSVFQYIIFVYTFYILAKQSYKFTNQKLSFYVVLILGVLNPYLIQSTTLFLTDIISTCFVTLSLIVLLSKDMTKFTNGLIVGTLLYSATMIRPSNAIFMGLLFFIFLYKCIKIRKIPYKFIVGGLLMLVIFIPQLYNNVVHYHKWTPFIVKNLYDFQAGWATIYLKYGTVIEPNETPQLIYQTPFKEDTGILFPQLLTKNFWHFLFVYICHIFAVLDWGIIDTFITKFLSPTRFIASFFLYCAWILIGFGVFTTIRNKKNLLIPTSLVFAALGYTLFIATTAVETRFGYPIFMILAPFAGIGAHLVMSRFKESKKYIVRYSYLFLVCVALFYYGSYLLDLTTGRINWF